jgi:cell division transport system permease protein
MALNDPAGNKPVRGASLSAVSWNEKVQAWFAHHRESARDSIQHQLRSPLQNLLTALVIGITLALPALLILGIENLQQLGETWDGSPRLSVYISRKVNDAQIHDIETAMHQNPAVLNVKLITPEQGLASFEHTAGMTGTMALLEENPLPPVLLAELQKNILPDNIQALQTAWQLLPNVDHVQIDMVWVQKLFKIMQLGERLTIGLATLLGLGALLSVGNTIRLSIENRRDEIVIAKLVGATDAFVRRPFLYSGFCYGFSGGIVAVMLVICGYYSLAKPVNEIAFLFQSTFTLHGIDIFTGINLVFVGIVLGMLGAWLAVGQHLHDMRPK